MVVTKVVIEADTLEDRVSYHALRQQDLRTVEREPHLGVCTLDAVDWRTGVYLQGQVFAFHQLRRVRQPNANIRPIYDKGKDGVRWPTHGYDEGNIRVQGMGGFREDQGEDEGFGQCELAWAFNSDRGCHLL